MVKIYKIYFKENPKVVYIGKTTQKLKNRLSQHKHLAITQKKNSKVYNWLRKNINNGLKPIIEEILTCEDGDSGEIQMIKEYKKLNYKLKNTTDGGGGKPSGLKMPEEYCKYVSERNKENEVWSGEDNPFYGKTGKKNHKSKEVFKYNLKGEFLKKYESQRLAAIDIGVPQNSRLISRACKTGEMAYGFLWSATHKDKLQPYQPKIKKMSKEDIKLAKELYQQGTSINQISKIIGVSRGQIKNKII